MAALTAVAIFVSRDVLLQLLGALWPQVTTLRINAPQFVAIPFPVFFTAGTALLRAIELSGAIALFWVAVSPFRRRFPWLPATIAILGVFFAGIDQSANLRQMPLMLVDALSMALAVWLVARYVLRDNLLAYPLAAALLILLQSGGAMLSNHRTDLTANAVATLGAATALLLWVVLPGVIARSREPNSTTPADNHSLPK